MISCRLLVAMLLLAGFVIAENDETSRLTGQELVSHARQIMADPRYQQALPGQEQTELPQRRSRSVLPSGPLEAPVPMPESGVNRLAWGLLWAMLVLMLGYLVMWAFQEFRSLRRQAARLTATGDAGSAAAAGEKERYPTLADQLAAGGRFTEAVHALLVDALLSLERTQKVTIHPSTTSREVIRQLAGDGGVLSLLTTLVVAVEHSLFAGMSISRDDYQRCRDAWWQIIRESV
jgi:hypothetical protein